MVNLFFFFSGPVLVTAEGGAHAPHHETGGVLVHAPGRGGGGTAADPAHAVEDIVTAIAMSRAQDTSKDRHNLYFTPRPNKIIKKQFCLVCEFTKNSSALMRVPLVQQLCQVLNACLWLLGFVTWFCLAGRPGIESARPEIGHGSETGGTA